ncbi:flagellin [Rhizobium gallicum]|uniref:flagellin n=1 Tax=Rhizobium gallicum TaxID=56730 RepID=UPI001F224B93|nr:flagellin [Rhizobium gallicum]
MFDQINTSLFNKEGDGMLQGDPRSPKTIGGIRPYGDPYTPDITNDYLSYYTLPGLPAISHEKLPFTVISGTEVPTPVSLGAGDKISFDLTIDGDNPAQGLAAPLHPGISASDITIDSAMVASLGGAIHNATEMAQMLNNAFAAKGIGSLVYAAPVWHDPLNAPPYPDPVRYTISTTEQSLLNGSQVQISNFSSTVSGGSLANLNIYGSLGSSFTLDFTPFKIYRDVSIDFTFGINSEATETHTIDRNTVNAILGTTDGWINTTDDMVTILNALITRPNTIIEANGSAIRVRSDPLDDRLNGGRTQIGFTNMTVNVEPIPMNGVMHIDIEKYPGSVNSFLYSVDAMLGRVTNGAAALGALKNRLEKQAAFSETLIDDLSSGIGRLVDADMEEVSSKLAALQTQ